MAEKRDEHWRAFDGAWFERHQALLLWLLNAPVLCLLVRWVFRIRSYDCPRDVEITHVGPNRFGWDHEDGRRTTDFRTHDKFSKRVYYALKPLWWALHYWDEAFADRYAPGLSFGFSTLTVYPQPNPASTACDGWVSTGPGLGDVSWATLIADGGGNHSATDTILYVLWEDGITPGTWDWLVRSITLFDTSALTASATISAGVLSVSGYSKSNDDLASPNIDIYTSTPASNTTVADSDFAQIGSVSQTGAPISYSGFSTVAYNDFTFNSTGRGNVSKTGVSKFGLRNSNYDVAATPPPNLSIGQSYLTFYASDYAGTSSDPKLVVTYTLPAGGFNALDLAGN